MGRSESSILARNSWISGVGYLCDMAGEIVCLSSGCVRAVLWPCLSEWLEAESYLLGNPVTLVDPIGSLIILTSETRRRKGGQVPSRGKAY